MGLGLGGNPGKTGTKNPIRAQKIRAPIWMPAVLLLLLLLQRHLQIALCQVVGGRLRSALKL
jgi:hypothetical protein